MLGGGLTGREDWEWRALCGPLGSVDPDLFFRPELVGQVRRLCLACPVAWECFDFGRRNLMYGVWGGIWLGDRGRYSFSIEGMTRERHKRFMDKKRRSRV